MRTRPHSGSAHGRWDGGLQTASTASSLALSVSVTRSVRPLNSMLRGLSTRSLTTCRMQMLCALVPEKACMEC
jgi:hypothetical protein